MKPAPFDYIVADSSDELCALLTEFGSDAAILAGGQSLLPLLNQRQQRPSVLLDLAGCRELRQVAHVSGQLCVAAGVTQATLEHWPLLHRELPLIAQALPHLGSPQIRSRGTVCGSLAHAHPSAELPLCLLALAGSVVLRSMRGERQVTAKDFFCGALRTARQPDEFLQEARWPLALPDMGYAFEEVALRNTGQAIVACAAVAAPSCLRLAIAGVSETPWLLEWPVLDPADVADAVAIVAQTVPAGDDGVATAAYRRQLVRHLGHVVLRQAQKNAKLNAAQAR